MLFLMALVAMCGTEGDTGRDGSRPCMVTVCHYLQLLRMARHSTLTFNQWESGL